MQDGLEGLLPLHLDGGAGADHADDFGVGLCHRPEHVDLDLGDPHVGAVQAFGLTHLVEAEEIEDDVRALRRLDGFL